MSGDAFHVYFGDVTPTAADVHLQVTDPSLLRMGLRVNISGPYCRLAKTLPADFRFDSGLSRGHYRASIVDPCFWSQGYPALYRWQVEDTSSAQLLATGQIGIRHFGTRGDHFWLEGRRWVLRAAERQMVTDLDLASWRDASLAIVTSTPTATLCDEASQHGVMMLVREVEWNSHRARTLTRWAAVCLVILPSEASVDREVARKACPNLLLAAEVSQLQQQLPTWADAIIVPADSALLRLAESWNPKRPVLVSRPLATHVSAGKARRGCEQLQRDLAPEHQLSGYLV